MDLWSVNVPAKFEVRSFIRSWDNSDWGFIKLQDPHSWPQLRLALAHFALVNITDACVHLHNGIFPDMMKYQKRWAPRHIQSRPVCSVWRSRPRDSARAPADRVRSGRYATDLAPVLPWWPESVCEDWSAPVKLLSSSGVRTTELGPILFAIYASPVADVTASHGVQYHQYADATQLRLAMHADNTSAGLSVLAACTADVRQFFVHVERPAAQPGQIRSTDHRNGTPATCCDINRVVPSLSPTSICR